MDLLLQLPRQSRRCPVRSNRNPGDVTTDAAARGYDASAVAVIRGSHSPDRLASSSPGPWKVGSLPCGVRAADREFSAVRTTDHTQSIIKHTPATGIIERFARLATAHPSTTDQPRNGVALTGSVTRGL